MIIFYVWMFKKKDARIVLLLVESLAWFLRAEPKHIHSISSTSHVLEHRIAKFQNL